MTRPAPVRPLRPAGRPARCRRLRRVAAAAALLLVVGGCTARPGTAASAAGLPASTTTAAGTAAVGTAGPGTATPPTTGPRATGPGTTGPGTAGPGTATRRATGPVTGTPGAAPTATTRPATPAGPAPSAPTVAGGACVAGHCYRVGPIYQLPAGVAPESSGIAASARAPGVFFVVDDGTGVGEVDAVRSDGSLVARIAVAGMSARNAEAVTAGTCGSRAGRCLYVGDIGDNDARRRSIIVYRIDEPALFPAPSGPVAADRWVYTYPDGPHNAEALVVAADGSLLLLTKSAPDPVTGAVPPHRIYRASAGGGVLRYVSAFRPPDPAVAVQSMFTGTVVTDAAYSPGRMLLLTYDEVVEYRAPDPGADPAGFPSWPHAELPAPALIQSEGITADTTGCGYEVTSEEGPGGTTAGLAGVTCD